MKYTIITGNPIDGFQCWGIFDTELAAAKWANNDPDVPRTWEIMAINSTDDVYQAK